MILASKKKSPANYGMRWFEAETAEINGIPFDREWYSIDVYTREQMIASRIARATIGNLLQQEAMAKR